LCRHGKDRDVVAMRRGAAGLAGPSRLAPAARDGGKHGKHRNAGQNEIVHRGLPHAARRCGLLAERCAMPARRAVSPLTASDAFRDSRPRNQTRARALEPAHNGVREMPAGNLLYYALVALIIAIIAGALGFGGIAGTATGIAQLLFYIFIIVFIVVLLFNFMGRRGPRI
jgi:uncharacterized membrane protein YtjA (UPF0391 family)